jgi:pimeloyl-ACP methyl ester carboxylesterase
MKTIYFISGLGADERAFQFLQQNGITGKHIKWVAPKKHEGLRDYCMRLTEQLDAPGGIVLIGVSFGGIVAQEISKLVKVDKVIILSSVKSAKELGWRLNLVRALSLHKLAPSRFLKWSNLLACDYYFNIRTKAESKLLRLIVKDIDCSFMKWAIEAMMKWKGGAPNLAVVHIHGDKDRIFPIGHIKNAITIAGGSHFMIVNRAKEISELIEKEIG